MADTPVSPKVTAAAVAAAIIPTVLQLLAYLTTDAGKALYADLPLWAGILIGIVVNGGLVFLSGYAKKDELRSTG
jgi:hypothetical protein